MSNKNKTVIEIIGTILIVVLVIVIARFDDIKGGFFKDSINFELTDGEIISSSFNFHMGTNSAPGYRYSVKYKFKAHEQEYISNNVNFGSKILKDKNRAKELVDKYPAGKQVTVYYEKNNPKFSALEPTKNANTQFIIISFFFIILLFVVSGTLYIRLKGK